MLEGLIWSRNICLKGVEILGRRFQNSTLKESFISSCCKFNDSKQEQQGLQPLPDQTNTRETPANNMFFQNRFASIHQRSIEHRSRSHPHLQITEATFESAKSTNNPKPFGSKKHFHQQRTNRSEIYETRLHVENCTNGNFDRSSGNDAKEPTRNDPNNIQPGLTRHTNSIDRDDLRCRPGGECIVRTISPEGHSCSHDRQIHTRRSLLWLHTESNGSDQERCDHQRRCTSADGQFNRRVS